MKLLPMLFSLLIAPGALAASIQIPPQCAPKEYGTDYVTKTTHLFSLGSPSQLYHFFRVVGHRGTTGIVVMKQQGGACVWGWSDPGGEGGSFLQTLPRAVAYRGALELVQGDLKSDRAGLVARLRRGGSVPPEFYAAYKKLGLNVSNLKISPVQQP